MSESNLECGVQRKRYLSFKSRNRISCPLSSENKLILGESCISNNFGKSSVVYTKNTNKKLFDGRFLVTRVQGTVLKAIDTVSTKKVTIKVP